MKVKEILKALEQFDPESDVFCYIEEPSQGYQNANIFDIEDINNVEAVKSRLESSQPVLKFEKNELSEPHVILTINSDF